LRYPDAQPKEICEALNLDHDKYANMVSVAKTYLKKQSIPREMESSLRFREQEITIKLKETLRNLGYVLKKEKFDLYEPDIVAEKNSVKFIFEVKVRLPQAKHALRQLACAKVCLGNAKDARYVAVLPKPPSYSALSTATKYGFEFWVFYEDQRKLFIYKVSLEEVS